MNKLILVDLDDVLVNWRSGFFKYMAANGFETPENSEPGSIDAWMNAVPEIRNDGWIEKFNNSPDFAHLDPFDDAVEVLHQLHAKGWRFIAISMVGKGHGALMNRYENLQRHYPDVLESIIHTEFRHGAKKEYLDWFKPTAWVEDNFYNAQIGADVGHTSYLIERKPLPDDSRLIKVRGWHDIAAHLEANF